MDYALDILEATLKTRENLHEEGADIGQSESDYRKQIESLESAIAWLKINPLIRKVVTYLFLK